MPTTQQVYSMLGNENLWRTAAECHQILADAEIPHSVCGGVAVCLHGYQRNTVGLGLIIRKDDAQRVRSILEQAGLVWDVQEVGMFRKWSFDRQMVWSFNFFMQVNALAAAQRSIFQIQRRIPT